MNKYPLFIFIFLAYLTGCNPQSKGLEVKLNQGDLCVFTNNPKTDYGIDNTFLIYLGRIDYSKDFKSTYEKLYSNTLLPIDEKNCIAIPLNEIERNIAYEIVLDTNKSVHTSICVMDKGNKLEVKYLEQGKSTCN
ncbi:MULTISPECIES: NF045616 family extracytoplasmic (lipo)protein [Acinetobacter]|uniref:NF045616 family extracytoplasmic (lipo)protein n=1 Tax=Acinetobacter TaxID=469 RepID=UPI00064829F6|nr:MULTISPECIES: NF045616 family extracytoplasmic (lipo)protein [Acinetobacter]MBJ8481354.1 hypothetical protein [Acinetobacter vivianii]